MRVILTTVGTSLIENTKRAAGLTDVSDRQLVEHLKRMTPVEASAETNSLSRLMEKGDHVVLLHSATDKGRTCASALIRWIEKQNVGASMHEIAHLSYESKAFKLRGLGSLASALAREIRKARQAGAEPVINATGGFKAEAAVAAQVGQVFGIPVYYIHDAFKEIIELPSAPIGWDYSAIAEYEAFFAWISADYRPIADVERKWPALPAKIGNLLVDEDGYRALSPMGEAYYEAFHEALSLHSTVPVMLSTAAKRWYDRAEPSTRELFDAIFARLRVPGIRAAASKSEPNCDCPVFPSGRYYGRIFYTLGDDGCLRVLEMTLHDDNYDKLIRNGVKRGDYVEFVPV